MATAQQVLELVQKMHQARGDLFETVSTMTEEEAEVRHPDRDGEEGWSVKDILAHLRWMDSAYRGWVTRAINEDRPDVSKPLPGTAPQPDGPHYLETSHDFPIVELVQALERERSTSMSLIAGLSLDQFDRTAINPIFGELTVLQWLRSYYRHDRQHIAQMKREESEFQPRFASGQEPDQRLKR